MFESRFSYASVLHRHREGPLAAERSALHGMKWAECCAKRLATRRRLYAILRSFYCSRCTDCVRVKCDDCNLQLSIGYMYAAGLRPSEGLRLRCCDVDLSKRVLSVWDNKFFKSRLVPMCSLAVSVRRTASSF